MSPADPLIDADAPLSTTVKDIPVIPSTDTALLQCFPFEPRFPCDIAEFLPYICLNARRTQHIQALFGCSE
jgi:hypothetical protein